MTKRKDYEVGWGKPPKSTRFTKGQSGNPAGRKKGSSNLATIVRRELEEEVTIRQGDHTETVSKLEAMVKRVFNDGLNGKPQATKTSFDLAERYLPEIGEDDEGAITSDQQAIIERYLARPPKAPRKRSRASLPRKRTND